MKAAYAENNLALSFMTYKRVHKLLIADIHAGIVA